MVTSRVLVEPYQPSLHTSAISWPRETTLSRLATSTVSTSNSLPVSGTSLSPTWTRWASRSTCEPAARRVAAAAADRRTPEQGAQAGQQLGEAERLGEVVVGAGVEPDDAVELAGARGEHQDRALEARPRAARGRPRGRPCRAGRGRGSRCRGARGRLPRWRRARWRPGRRRTPRARGCARAARRCPPRPRRGAHGAGPCPEHRRPRARLSSAGSLRMVTGSPADGRRLGAPGRGPPAAGTTGGSTGSADPTPRQSAASGTTRVGARWEPGTATLRKTRQQLSPRRCTGW